MITTNIRTLGNPHDAQSINGSSDTPEMAFYSFTQQTLLEKCLLLLSKRKPPRASILSGRYPKHGMDLNGGRTENETNKLWQEEEWKVKKASLLSAVPYVRNEVRRACEAKVD